MDRSPATSLIVCPAKVATGSEDEHGALVFLGDHLVAILVRLDASYHDVLRGFWHLEAGFGPCAGVADPFRGLSDGLRWIGARLGLSDLDVGEALREADLRF